MAKKHQIVVSSKKGRTLSGKNGECKRRNGCEWNILLEEKVEKEFIDSKSKGVRFL